LHWEIKADVARVWVAGKKWTYIITMMIIVTVIVIIRDVGILR